MGHGFDPPIGLPVERVSKDARHFENAHHLHETPRRSVLDLDLAGLLWSWRRTAAMPTRTTDHGQWRACWIDAMRGEAMTQPIPIRFVEHYGFRAWLRVYWTSPSHPCVPHHDGTTSDFHDAMTPLCDGAGVDAKPGGEVEDHARTEWPTQCDRCAAPVPEDRPLITCQCGCGELRRDPRDAVFQVFRKPLYATVDHSWIGLPGPGDAYYGDWYHYSTNNLCFYGWSNCDGRHLVVVTPDGHHWDTNGRASNCDLRDDLEHRCWVVHGDPRNGTLNIDKIGRTCGAGAGSIQTRQWHGFLHNGYLVPC